MLYNKVIELVIKLRRKIEHYTGYEINKEVMERINLIALKRYREGRYSLLYDGVNTLEELCYWNDSIPEQTNVILGEDWFIVYTNTEKYIEVNEWLAVDTVPNKLEQTMEMFNVLKNILLSSEDKRLIASMKHNTSYKFYASLLKRGFLQEYEDYIGIEPEMPSDVKKVRVELENKYGFIEDFLKDENRDKEQEEVMEDYIYHDVLFEITDKFKNRYKR